MKPILYDSKENNFEHLGLGVLFDVVECIVTEEENGIFVLSMEYPTKGILSGDLVAGMLIKADASRLQKNQLFKIVKVGKSLSGNKSIEAEHVSYELNNYPLLPFISGTYTPQAIMQKLSSNCVTNVLNFTFFSDITSAHTVTFNKYEQAKNLREALSKADNSILRIFGGTFQYDNWKVRLLKARGKNRGVVIRYGKNLIDASQEESIADTYTSIFPYKEIDGRFILLDSKVIDSEHRGKFRVRNILPVDFSSDDTVVDKTSLKNSADKFMSENQIGLPSINLKVKSAALHQALNFDNAIEDVIELCDVVSVYIERLDISVSAKVRLVKWNVLKERLEAIEIGDLKPQLQSIVNRAVASIKPLENPNTPSSVTVDQSTGKVYVWDIVTQDGVPSIKLREVTV